MDRYDTHTAVVDGTVCAVVLADDTAPTDTKGTLKNDVPTESIPFQDTSYVGLWGDTSDDPKEEQ